jgi:hypothetical protein
MVEVLRGVLWPEMLDFREFQLMDIIDMVDELVDQVVEQECWGWVLDQRLKVQDQE